METPEVWILEDSEFYVRMYEHILSERYKLRFFENLESFGTAQATAHQKRPILFIADLKLPDGSFAEFMERDAWRKAPLTPFLVASGVTDIEIMRQCLNEGAFDYITKPFVDSELLVKVELADRAARQALQKRDENTPSFDHANRFVRFEGKQSDLLTVRESQIFMVLADAYESSVSRDDIVAKVWRGERVSSKSFDVHLSHLRGKLAEISLKVQLVGTGGYQLLKSNS